MNRIPICVLVSCLGFCVYASGQTGIIATVAGNGNYGFSGDGGPATAAELSPAQVAVDASGNLFIADAGNNRIRKVSPGGIITTIAGNGNSSFSGDGGPAASASLSYPGGVAVDASGNLYIADSGNGRIRKVSPGGIITTVAGKAAQGFSGDGGLATAASLSNPQDSAVDSSGNLYIADTGNNRVRKVSLSGIITTVAGSGKFGFAGDGGPASSASLSNPVAVAADASGNLYIADQFNGRIRKVSGSGTITTVAGNGNFGFSGDGGTATSATLSIPRGVAVDASGNLYIADSGNARIRKVSAGGIITTVAGNGNYGASGDGGPATSASLSYPTGVAANATGNFFIADNGSNRIREVLVQSIVPPIVIFANNSADYSTTVAQGSLFVLFGSSMGPATLAQVSAFPLPNALSETSVTVTFGTTTLTCPMIYTSSGQVAAILPSNTPAGPASVTVAYNGQTAPYGLSTTQVTVVPTSVGIYTTTSSGFGTGIFTALNGAVITFANSAQPGQAIYIWGTGIGPITTPDNVLPTSYPNYPNVQVWVGGLEAQIIYDGRSGCCSGVDQIVFYVPAVGNGCNVPVTIVSGGIPSNPITLPVSASGGACSDTGPTLPTSFLTKADAGQAVKVAAIVIGPELNGSGSASAQDVARSLSAELHTRVSEADAAILIRAYKSKRPRAIRMAMAKYWRQWKALDEKTKERINAQLGQTQEGAAAEFGSFSGEALAAAVASAQFPTPGACIILPQSINSGLGAAGAGLDAGSSLSLTGPAGSLTLQEAGTRPGQYKGAFAAAVTGPDIPLGSYTISGSGGKDAGAFTTTISIGSHLAITNKTALATISRAQPATVTWSGGVAGNYVLIGGYSHSNNSTGLRVPNALFVCAEDAGKGTLTIPAYILSSMDATATGKGVLAISPHPLSHSITIPGIDLAYFVDGSSDSVNVTFQ